MLFRDAGGVVLLGALGLLLAGCGGGSVKLSDGEPVDSVARDSDPEVEVVPSARGPWLREERQTPGSITFNELLYHPPTDEDLEWIELHNPMVLDMDLSGWSLAGGVDYTFPTGTVMPAGGFLVVAADPARLASEAGFEGALGPYEGRLSNSGERLKLLSGGGRLIDTVEYADDAPWPPHPDGSGVSLAKIHADAASDRAEHWTTSAELGGTPGEAAALDPLAPPITRTLVPLASTWRYEASGEDPDAGWAELDYDDSAWESGEAVFYAGVSPEALVATAWATADNYFALYLGHADGGELRWVGEDLDGSWTTVEEIELELGPEDHLYLAAWELPGDSTSPQMLIAEVELPEGLVGTDAAGFEWVLGPSGANPGELTTSAAPSEAELFALIEDANADASWASPAAEAGRSTSPWGGTVGGAFTDAARFIWGDTFNNDSLTNSEESYALFRTRAPVLGEQGSGEFSVIPTAAYFRQAFTFDEDASLTELRLECVLDDGAVVRLNGVELSRENMPEGAVSSTTLAAAPVDEALEVSAEVSFELTAEALRRGENVLAVELHQAELEDLDLRFGCALSARTWPETAEPTLLLNELAPAGEAAEGAWVELIDVSQSTQDLGGLVLASSLGDELVLPAGQLGPGERLLVDALGFSLEEGELLFLYSADRGRLLDAVRIHAGPRARAEGGGPWRAPVEATPGEPNLITLSEGVVINELQYNPTGDPVGGSEAAGEWIELYNRGEEEVDLSGWQLVDAVAFLFPEGTTLAPDAYLVVAEDAEALRAAHPGIEVLGELSGRLGNGGERLLLLDAAGNPADELRYFDGGRWPEAADGGGASLELRDPWADNSAPEAWAASEELARTAWVEVSYRGVAEASAVGPDGVWEELVLGLLDAGVVLIDDLSVLRDPDGQAVELLQDGGFDGGFNDGAERWRLLGNHGHSEVVPDPDDPSNPVLRLEATGATGHMHNHAETTLREPISAQEYEISFRARWLSGSPQLNSRLYFNRLPRTHILERPTLSGTPGARNSTAVDNLGPTFADLRQDLAVPAPYEPVVVSIEVTDVDGVEAVRVWTSVDGGAFRAQPMAETTPGRWEAALEGQPAGALVQLYVEAEDGLGVTATFPAAGPDSRALYAVDDGRAGGGGLHALRILMTPADADWLHEDVNLMSNDLVGATVVYKESEVFYDVGVRLKGSQRGRPTAARVGYGLRFNDEQPFRGSHSSVMIDRSEGVNYGQREVLLNLMMTRAGSVSGEYNDLIRLVAPRSDYDGPAELQLDRFTDLVLAAQFADGGSGTRFEYELVYYPYTSDDGTAEGLKLPQPDSVIGTAFTDLGDDKEAYRWSYLIKNNADVDDYSAIMEMCQLFDLSDSSFLARAEEVIDVEQWLRAFAFSTLSGATDQYGGAGSQHNAQLYVRPEDGRVLFFPHDLDYFSSSSMPVIGNRDLARLLEDPVYERSYYGHLQDIIQQAYNLEYLSPWCEQLGALMPDQNFDAHCAFVDARVEWVLNGSSDAVMRRFPAQDFRITTGGGQELSVEGGEVELEGTGWVDVRGIARSGSNEPLALTWTSDSTWRVVVPLEAGRNEITLLAIGVSGEAVGSDSVVVVSGG